MPRKSSAELTTFPRIDCRPDPLEPRSKAPAEVKSVFRELVSSVPPEHFRSGDSDLVELYAQSIVLGRRAYTELAKEPVIDGRPSPWNAILEKAHRSAVAFSARLRLAPQSRLDQRAAGRQPLQPAFRPWDEDE